MSEIGLFDVFKNIKNRCNLTFLLKFVKYLYFITLVHYDLYIKKLNHLDNFNSFTLCVRIAFAK